MHQTVCRVGFGNHPANRVALRRGVRGVVVVIIVLVHGLNADRAALLF